MLMERLSTIITRIYAMTAVIGRASRSYCTGIRFSDNEVINYLHIILYFGLYFIFIVPSLIPQRQWSENHMLF